MTVLPGSANYFVINDQNGYVWMAGDQGISRFDGRNFRNFYTAKNVSANSIICIDLDSQDNVFFVASDGMVGRIRNDLVEKLPVSDALAAQIRHDAASIVTFKIDANGDIHLGTSFNPYVIFAESGYTQFSIRKFDSSIYAVIYALNNGKSITSIVDATPYKIQTQDKRGMMEVGVMDGGKVFKERISFSLEEGVNSRMSSAKLRDGRILFSFLNSLYEYHNGKFSFVREFATTILTVFEDKEGNLLVSLSNGNGVALIQNGDRNAIPQKLFMGETIGSITEDFEGGIWMSSLQNGVYYIPYLHNVSYQNYPGLDEAVQDITVIDSMVYIATNDHHVYVLDQLNNVRKSEPLASINNVGDLRIRSCNNRIYYCGSTGGELNPATLQLKTYIGDNWKDVPVSTNDMAYDPKFGLVGLSYNKLYRIENLRWIEIVNMQVRGTCLLYTQQREEVWIGTRNGLYAFRNNDVVEIFPDILAGQVITSMVQSESGFIYITTKSAGVFIYRNNEFTRLSSENGLSSDFCSDVYVDDQRRVWVSTKQGINYFTEGDLSVMGVLNRSNGLNSNETNGCCKRGNTLYVVTRDGLELVDLMKFDGNQMSRKIILENILVNGNPYQTGQSLSYTDNNIVFQVAAISFHELFTERYAYQLVGYDSTMQLTSNDVVEFKRLPHGHYDLYLADVDQSGNVHSSKLYFSFDIESPFWVKWWFILLMSLILFLLIYLIIRARVAHYNRKLKEKSEIEMLIAESRITALRAQMNPHFIFNSINSIQDFVLNNETQQAYDYLSKFAKLIRMVLNNSRENEISLEKEIDWLKLYISLEQLRFRNSFEFVLEMDESVSENLDLRIPTMILQPYVENAIWHGLMPLLDQRRGILKISCVMMDDTLCIDITDNGVGRKKSAELHEGDIKISMGMSLVSEKIDALKKMNQTTFNVVITDLFDQERAAGTNVRITIEL
jgi:hypothetical protein